MSSLLLAFVFQWMLMAKADSTVPAQPVRIVNLVVPTAVLEKMTSIPVAPTKATSQTATNAAATASFGGQVPPSHGSGHFLLGIGSELDGAVKSRLFNEAPINLLTSWFNSPNDLTFMRGFQNKEVPAAYASGRSLHLVVWTGSAESEVTTKYGKACGRTYPFSASFADDMKQLANIYRGSGTLYVSMFTEFQTYPCQDNNWLGNENYYLALQDQYRLAQQIFKAEAPNARLALSWGGWQASYDDPARGGGRSLFSHFADVMNNSDFQSFQAMDSTSNIQPIKDMTRQLHGYGNGAVLLAHYKPDNRSQVTWTNDITGLFGPDVMAGLQQNGLFGLSFMDEANMNATESAFQLAKQFVTAFAR
ncbi:hypothetical protein H7Y63_00435 [Polaromonas sp.]|nr:hypothetical protein [Candidatus Saccharibacteria bacterium]